MPLTTSQFVALNGLFFPFYTHESMLYPDYSRPFSYNGSVYTPYSGEFITPNEGQAIQAAGAPIVVVSENQVRQ